MDKLVYEMKQIGYSDIELNANVDYLLLAAGVDTRAYNVLEKLTKNKMIMKKPIVVDFSERHRNNDTNYMEKYYKYKTINKKFIDISGSIHEPKECLNSLGLDMLKLGNKCSLGIDISCFTKPYIFAFLKYLVKPLELERVKIFYTEPQSYLFENGYCKSYKLSSGPIRVEELPSYTGSGEADAENLLVIILGFEGDLTKEIKEDVPSKKIVLINGFPSYSPKFKDISLINNEYLLTDSDNDIIYSKANNPFEMYNTLEKIYDKYFVEKKMFINIVPTGSKPMALGACLFALHHPNVRIVYPKPESYINKENADDNWLSWMYEIPLFVN